MTFLCCSVCSTISGFISGCWFWGASDQLFVGTLVSQTWEVLLFSFLPTIPSLLGSVCGIGIARFSETIGVSGL